MLPSRLNQASQCFNSSTSGSRTDTLPMATVPGPALQGTSLPMQYPLRPLPPYVIPAPANHYTGPGGTNLSRTQQNVLMPPSPIESPSNNFSALPFPPPPIPIPLLRHALSENTSKSVSPYLQRPPLIGRENFPNNPNSAPHQDSSNPVIANDSLDAAFVKEFERSIQCRQNLGQNNYKSVNDMTKDKPKKTLSLLEAKDIIFATKTLLQEIATLRDYLIDNMRISDSQWIQTEGKIWKLKEVVDANQARLKCARKDLEAKIKERQKKRDRVRRKKAANNKKRIEVMIQRMKQHREIDEWQHKKSLKDKANRMVESLKSEAGETLSGVRKKTSEIEKLASILTSLLELRTIRRQTSLSRGIFVFEEDDEAFEANVQKSLAKTEIRKKIYREEENALLVMMEEEREEFTRIEEEKRNRRLKEEEEREANNPILPYQRYWLQAEENIEFLISVRRAWDVYISPLTLLGSSRIPDGWIPPPEPKSEAWARYCQRKK